MSAGAQRVTLPIEPVDRDLSLYGACVGAEDPDIWFQSEAMPGRKGRKNPDTLHAIAICHNDCIVRDECLAYALRTPVEHDWGVWGGLTETQRRALRRIQRSKAKAA